MGAKVVVGVRHLKDKDQLVTSLFDAPLRPNQGGAAAKIARRILHSCEVTPKKARVLHSSFRRSVQTAEMLAVQLRRLGVDVATAADEGLNEFDQGRTKFPHGYKDGDRLPSLPLSWDDFCVETYSKGNLDHKFGSGKMAEYFESPGESLLDVLPRQYAFFERLFSGELERGVDLLVLCCHTTTLHIISELKILAVLLEFGYLSPDFPPTELPRRLWEVFKAAKAGGSLKKHIAFGEAKILNLEAIRNSVLPAKIAAARLAFHVARFGSDG